MIHLLPTKRQWREWSLPSKLTCIGTYVTLLSILVSIAFYVWPFRGAKDEQAGGLTGQVRDVVEEIVVSAESKKPTRSLGFGTEDVNQSLSEDLKRDPYNVRALILRGQSYYVETKNFGRLRFREALNDFRRAALVNTKLADPHFGLGTVLYQIGLFDLANRGLYKIYEKGAVLFDKQAATTRMREPRWDFYVDTRNRLVLQAALDEFQVGQRLQQIYEQSSGGTVIFFAPQDIENRVRSVRTLMGYEPSLEPDSELVMNFTSILASVNSGDVTQVLNLGDQRQEHYEEEAEAALTGGNVTEALRLADIAVQEGPQDARAYSIRAMAYARKGNWKRAVDDLTVAVEHDPANAKWVFNRGVARRHLGQRADAIADFERTLELHPPSDVAAAARSELAKL